MVENVYYKVCLNAILGTSWTILSTISVKITPYNFSDI